MSNIEIGLKRVGSVVFGMVLGQDEKLRGDLRLFAGCFEICSARHPELTEVTLYVRGDETDKDLDLFYYDYDTEKEAVNVYNNIVKLVHMVNRQKQPEQETHTHGLDVIE